MLAVFGLRIVEGTPTEATTRATFWNNGIDVSIEFDLVWESGIGWQIDHLSGVAGELTWCSGTFVQAVQDSGSPR
jgi:hypothetical protein